MASSLKWLYTQNQAKGFREWIDVPNTAPKEVLRSNQLPTLRWWGLVERESPDPKSKKKHSGHWRITLKGMDFVEGKTLVPKKVMTYNGDVVGMSDDDTNYEDCLKRSFDYKDVMQETHIVESKKLFAAGDEPLTKLFGGDRGVGTSAYIANDKINASDNLAACESVSNISHLILGFERAA
jgi:hypothetical protein